MRKFFALCIVMFSISASAQISKISILKVVLTDSIVSKYMFEDGGIDTTNFVLFENSGYYFYNYGNLEYKEQQCEKEPLISGNINKLKVKKTEAVVKIYFNGNNAYYTKVKLEQEIDKKWQIKSRFIYRNFQFPRDESRQMYYSLN